MENYHKRQYTSTNVLRFIHASRMWNCIFFYTEVFVTKTQKHCCYVFHGIISLNTGDTLDYSNGLIFSWTQPVFWGETVLWTIACDPLRCIVKSTLTSTYLQGYFFGFEHWSIQIFWPISSQFWAQKNVGPINSGFFFTEIFPRSRGFLSILEFFGTVLEFFLVFFINLKKTHTFLHWIAVVSTQNHKHIHKRNIKITLKGHQPK